MIRSSCMLLAIVGFVAPAHGQSAVLRDSAGVRITRYPASSKGNGTARPLEATPSVVVGTSDNPDASFTSATAAVRLGDGSIVVADGRRNELRLFSATGTFVRKIGRSGEGPGDFRQLTSVFALPGDTILVWDGVLSRITRYSRDGRVGGTRQVERLPSTADPSGRGRSTPVLFAVGALADGTLMGYYGPVHYNPPTGMNVDSMTVTHITAEGGYAALGVFPRGESFYFNSAETRRSTGGVRPFTARPSLVAGRASLWLTDGKQFALREYSPAGKLLRIVELLRQPAAVTPADIEAYRKAERDDARTRPMRDTTGRAGAMQFTEQLLKWLTFPEQQPAWTALLVAGNGDLWARQAGDSTSPQRWDLFDAMGRYRGVVQVPAEVEVLDVGADYLLGRVTDKDDVETVRVYRLK